MADAEPTQGDLLRPLPATTARVIRFSVEIAETQPDRPDYLHSVLCQVGLPRSWTAGFKFKRTNGNTSLLVEAGSLWDGTDWVEQPLPYGTRPRLALVYVSSDAVRTKSPMVELGVSARSLQHGVLNVRFQQISAESGMTAFGQPLPFDGGGSAPEADIRKACLMSRKRT